MSEPRGWLIAVYKSEPAALDAADRTRRAGTDADTIRIGDPIDALTSIRGELREEVNDVVGATSGPPGGATATIMALPLAATAGTTLAVPDTRPARHALVRSGPVRIDVVAPDGRPVDTLKARGVRPARALFCAARQLRRLG
jgi:hypothetical protein